MSNSKINTAIRGVLHGIDNGELAPRLKILNTELDAMYDVYGFLQYRRMILQFLYTLLVHQKPIGHLQRWEIPGLARSIARMSCMKHFYLRNDTWLKVRTDLEYFLDRAADGELRLASEQDFLNEFQTELVSAKDNFYESCRQRCGVFKRELVDNVMHPDRIEKLLNEHGMEMLEHIFGY
jgi:hypothetical protein